MHPSLTSREQDLAAMPKHQALLKNLGIGPLLKSQVHADAFRSLLRQDGNDSHAAPSNPMKMFRSKDSTLTPSQNAAHERLRKQEYRDAEKLRRMSESRANGGISTDEEAERIHALLAEGGEIFMPMQETFYATRFSMLRDRFGTSWMVIHERPMPAA